MYGDCELVHIMYMATKVISRLKDQPRWRPNYIRAWRKKEGLTLARLAERVKTAHPGIKGATHASISRIERQLQPYSQGLLEALADELHTDPASLLIRDPNDPEGIWSIWDQVQPSHRRQLVEIGKTFLKTGS